MTNSGKQRKPENKYRFRWTDGVLIAGILCLAGLIYGIAFLQTGNQAGNQVVILIDGETYGQYDLSQNQEIPIQTERGFNRVVIQDGTVWMEEADCPDAYCIRSGAISKNGQTIVCLPHRLVVELRMTESGQGEVDAVAQ